MQHFYGKSPTKSCVAAFHRLNCFQQTTKSQELTMESTAKIEPQKVENAGQERSTIQFPYSDLDAAVEVARGVHNAGGTACDTDQLAAQLKMEAKGGGFRMRVTGAQTFNLINYERGGRIVLTDLGRQVVDPIQERQARMNAFLAVELFAKVYEEYKGGPLPPQAALERAIASMGVGSKVKDRARQSLMRSAKQAGFFEQAADRLIKPIIKSETPPTPKDENNGEKPINGGGAGGSGGGGGGAQHPLIQGLLVPLPKPGDEWSASERMNWLSMANFIFKTIYKQPQQDSGDVTLELLKGGNQPGTT